jgi:hypothetical protein
MLDPNVIPDAAKAGRQHGSAERDGTTGGFMAGVPAMEVDASGNAAHVEGTVRATSMQIGSSMADVKSSIESHLKAHQAMQSARRTFDYKPDMDDLRPTHAKGFPRELPEEFLAPFKR